VVARARAILRLVVCQERLAAAAAAAVLVIPAPFRDWEGPLLRRAKAMQVAKVVILVGVLAAAAALERQAPTQREPAVAAWAAPVVRAFQTT
jgi:hypothetical protein